MAKGKGKPCSYSSRVIEMQRRGLLQAGAKTEDGAERREAKEKAAREALLKKAKPITPNTLSIEMIEEATRKGVEALYRMEPSYTFRSDADLRNALRRKYGLWRNRGDEQKIIKAYTKE